MNACFRCVRDCFNRRSDQSFLFINDTEEGVEFERLIELPDHILQTGAVPPVINERERHLISHRLYAEYCDDEQQQADIKEKELLDEEEQLAYEEERSPSLNNYIVFEDFPSRYDEHSNTSNNERSNNEQSDSSYTNNKTSNSCPSDPVNCTNGSMYNVKCYDNIVCDELSSRTISTLADGGEVIPIIVDKKPDEDKLRSHHIEEEFLIPPEDIFGECEEENVLSGQQSEELNVLSGEQSEDLLSQIDSLLIPDLTATAPPLPVASTAISSSLILSNINLTMDSNINIATDSNFAVATDSNFAVATDSNFAVATDSNFAIATDFDVTIGTDSVPSAITDPALIPTDMVPNDMESSSESFHTPDPQELLSPLISSYDELQSGSDNGGNPGDNFDQLYQGIVTSGPQKDSEGDVNTSNPFSSFDNVENINSVDNLAVLSGSDTYDNVKSDILDSYVKFGDFETDQLAIHQVEDIDHSLIDQSNPTDNALVGQSTDQSLIDQSTDHSLIGLDESTDQTSEVLIDPKVENPPSSDAAIASGNILSVDDINSESSFIKINKDDDSDNSGESFVLMSLQESLNTGRTP